MPLYHLFIFTSFQNIQQMILIFPTIRPFGNLNDLDLVSTTLNIYTLNCAAWDELNLCPFNLCDSLINLHSDSEGVREKQRNRETSTLRRRQITKGYLRLKNTINIGHYALRSDHDKNNPFKLITLFTSFVFLFSPLPPDQKKSDKQAGLSRATLKISYGFSHNFPLKTFKSHYIFYGLSSSSIRGHL